MYSRILALLPIHSVCVTVCSYICMLCVACLWMRAYTLHSLGSISVSFALSPFRLLLLILILCFVLLTRALSLAARLNRARGPLALLAHTTFCNHSIFPLDFERSAATDWANKINAIGVLCAQMRFSNGSPPIYSPCLFLFRSLSGRPERHTPILHLYAWHLNSSGSSSSSRHTKDIYS